MDFFHTSYLILSIDWLLYAEYPVSHLTTILAQLEGTVANKKLLDTLQSVFRIIKETRTIIGLNQKQEYLRHGHQHVQPR